MTDVVVAIGDSQTLGSFAGPPLFYAVPGDELPQLQAMIVRLAKDFAINQPLLIIGEHETLCNAFVSQVARAKRDVLAIGSSSLESTDEEIEVILAHEMAHLERKHVLEKVYYSTSLPAYVNNFYELVPLLLAVALCILSAGTVGTIFAVIGFAVIFLKPFALRWVQQKQTAHSRAIEHDADRRAREVVGAERELLSKGLMKINKFEQAQKKRQDAGFATLKNLLRKMISVPYMRSSHYKCL